MMQRVVQKVKRLEDEWRCLVESWWTRWRGWSISVSLERLDILHFGLHLCAGRLINDCICRCFPRLVIVSSLAKKSTFIYPNMYCALYTIRKPIRNRSLYYGCTYQPRLRCQGRCRHTDRSIVITARHCRCLVSCWMMEWCWMWVRRFKRKRFDTLSGYMIDVIMNTKPEPLVLVWNYMVQSCNK